VGACAFNAAVPTTNDVGVPIEVDDRPGRTARPDVERRAVSPGSVVHDRTSARVFSRARWRRDDRRSCGPPSTQHCRKGESDGGRAAHGVRSMTTQPWETQPLLALFRSRPRLVLRRQLFRVRASSQHAAQRRLAAYSRKDTVMVNAAITNRIRSEFGT